MHKASKIALCVIILLAVLQMLDADDGWCASRFS